MWLVMTAMDGGGLVGVGGIGNKGGSGTEDKQRELPAGGKPESG